MERKSLHLLLFKIYLLASFFGHGQNQQTIDALFQVLKTDISDKVKVKTYVSIANEYVNNDSLNTVLYGNKAIELADRIGYTTGSIDAFYAIALMTEKMRYYSEAKELYTQMADVSKKNNYIEGMANAFYGLGGVGAFSGTHDQALKDLYRAIELYKELDDKNNLANCFNMIGTIYNMKSNYYKALEYYYQALEIFEALNGKEGMAVSYNSFGIIYSKMEDYEKAVENYSNALKVYKELGVKRGIALSHNNLGIAYQEQENYEKALESYLQSLKIKEEVGDRRGMAYTYSNMGKTQMKLESDYEALKYLSMALKIFKEMNADDQSYVLIDMGQIYRTQNKLILAKKYINEGLVLAKEGGYIEDILAGSEQLALLEKSQGNYQAAYEAQVLFKKMEDSLENKEAIKKIAGLEAKYEFQIEKDSLQFQQQQQVLLVQEEVERMERRRLVVYIIIGLLLTIGILVYISKNTIIQRRKFQSLRNRISNNLHDEIGSTLSSISLFGAVADKFIDEDPKKAHQLLSRINTNATQTIESMNDIVWAIKSENDSMFHLVNRMRSFASEIEDTGEWDIQIDCDPKITEKSLNMMQRKNVYLIYKEAVNNAVKYSQGNTIEIKMKADKNLIHMEIRDNGVGFEPNRVSENGNSFGGNGLKNMKMRAEELGGEVKINAAPEKGTQIITVFTN